jgi:hypothetical protein
VSDGLDGYRTVLLMDHRELMKKSDHKTTAASTLREAKVPWLSISLPLADYVWVAMPVEAYDEASRRNTNIPVDDPLWGQAYLLGYAAERKTADDLHGAMHKPTRPMPSWTTAPPGGAAGAARRPVGGSQTALRQTRWREQRERMLLSGLSRLIYLFEHNVKTV